MALDNARLVEELRHQAFHDDLTGLANRGLFGDRVEHALARSARTGASIAVLFLDLDDFKTVNDRFGHAGGDEMLRVVSGRIVEVLRPGRHRGAPRRRRVRGAHRGPRRDRGRSVRRRSPHRHRPGIPIRIGDSDALTGASVGIAISSAGDGRADDLLRNADFAMYRAKSAGKGRHELFQAHMREGIAERTELEALIVGAVEPRRAAPPVPACRRARDPGDRRGRGAGALAPVRPADAHAGRLHLPGRGDRARSCRSADGSSKRPAARVGSGRSSSAIPTSRSASTCRPASSSIRASSPRSLRPCGTPASIRDRSSSRSPRACSCSTRPPPSTSWPSSGPTASAWRSTTSGRATRRCRTSTGSRSTALKIDRSFVDGFGAGREGPVLVRAIIELGHALGLDVVAEGIEREDQVGPAQLAGLQARPGLPLRPAPGRREARRAPRHASRSAEEAGIVAIPVLTRERAGGRGSAGWPGPPAPAAGSRAAAARNARGVPLRTAPDSHAHDLGGPCAVTRSWAGGTSVGERRHPTKRSNERDAWHAGCPHAGDCQHEVVRLSASGTQVRP